MLRISAGRTSLPAHPTLGGAVTSASVRSVEGWVHTATVINLYSRKVVGYAVADHLRTSLIIEALAAALLTRRPPGG